MEVPVSPYRRTSATLRGSHIRRISQREAGALEDHDYRRRSQSSCDYVSDGRSIAAERPGGCGPGRARSFSRLIQLSYQSALWPVGAGAAAAFAASR